MSAKWNRKFDLNIILRKLSKIRTLDGENVSFSGFEYYNYIAVLKSMIEIDDNISPEVKNGFVVRGFHEAAKKKELKSRTVLSAINKVIREHNATPDRTYCLLTTLNIKSSNNLPKYTVNGCTLLFYKRMPKKYCDARTSAFSKVSSWLTDKDESDSYFVTVHTLAKNEFDAVSKMLDAIDFVRGIWNLHINKAMILSFGGKKKPINQITLGALHTLHNSDGSKASDTYWYEPEYYKNHTKVDFAKNSYKTLKFTKSVRNKLKKSRYGKDVEVAIIRYVRALDSLDYNATFIKLWSMLEYLTSTLHDNYDKTIKRTVFLYADHEYDRQVLEHLRQYRNKSVHSGTGENDIDTQVYQLKSYVENLLWFHIANHFKFDSFLEAAKFMDLQPDIGALKKQISLCQSGIKFMGG